MISRERNAYASVITRPPVKNYVYQRAHHTSSLTSIEDKPPRRRRIYSSRATNNYGRQVLKAQAYEQFPLAIISLPNHNISIRLVQIYSLRSIIIIISHSH